MKFEQTIYVCNNLNARPKPKRIHKLIKNLRYVTIDRDAAQNHWWNLVATSQLSPETFEANRTMIVENKAVSGILGHSKTRGFFMHLLRERSLHRRLERQAAVKHRHPEIEWLQEMTS